MLLELRIKDLALIDELSVEFGPGLNMLTGETGAGKTIVIGAINLLLGGRADASLVRAGAEKAVVEGRFSMPSSLAEELADFVDEGEVIVTRVIGKDGRSRGYVNGGPATAGRLAELTSSLIDLHGQHDQQSLFKPASHLDFLDQFAGERHLQKRAHFGRLFRSYAAKKRELDAVETERRALEGERERLEYQIAEIDRAALEPGEDEKLLSERELLRNFEKVFTAVQTAEAAIDGEQQEGGSVLGLLSTALGSMRGVAGLEAGLDKLTERLSDVYYELEDCAADLRGSGQNLSFQPGRLDEVESRMSEIASLKRKYGSSIDEVLSHRDSAQRDLDGLMSASDRSVELSREMAAIEAELSQAGTELSTAREEVAGRFQAAVANELGDLGMTATVFTVEIDKKKNEFLAQDERGFDLVEFQIAPSVGESLRPLTKIASGGEISRVMLALKIVLSKVDAVPTMIFDEVDTGIGGAVGNAVGSKLAALAKDHQVLVVTHLPQVARFADEHFQVVKEEVGPRLITRIEKLDEDGRVSEVARMLSGESSSETATRHARELLEQAGKGPRVSMES